MLSEDDKKAIEEHISKKRLLFKDLKKRPLSMQALLKGVITPKNYPIIISLASFALAEMEVFKMIDDGLGQEPTA